MEQKAAAAAAVVWGTRLVLLLLLLLLLQLQPRGVGLDGEGERRRKEEERWRNIIEIGGEGQGVLELLLMQGFLFLSPSLFPLFLLSTTTCCLPVPALPDPFIFSSCFLQIPSFSISPP